MKSTIFLISIVGLFACQPKKVAQKNTAEELRVVLDELTPSRLRGLGLVKNDMSLPRLTLLLPKQKSNWRPSKRWIPLN